MVTMLDNRYTDTINQDKRIVDMSNKIFLLEPDKTPLTVLLMRLRSMNAINPKFSWLEDELIPRTATVESGGVSGTSDTSVEVGTGEGDYFKAGDLVKVEATGEVFSVTSVAGDILTVVRGYGGTAGAIADASTLVNLGNASAENALAPVEKTTKSATVTNYCEILRTSVSGSRNLMKSSLYGGPDRAYQRYKTGIEHMVDMERKIWFGESNDGSGSSPPRRATGGILSFISTNITTLNSLGLTEDTLEDHARTVFRYGSSTKFAFCSPIAISRINGFARDKLQLVPTDQTFGIKIYRYLSGHGVLNIIRTVLFEDPYDEYMVTLDLENCGLKFVDKTHLKTNIQENDRDGWQDEYLTDFGVVCKLEKTHGVLKNVGGD